MDSTDKNESDYGTELHSSPEAIPIVDPPMGFTPNVGLIESAYDTRDSQDYHSSRFHQPAQHIRPVWIPPPRVMSIHPDSSHQPVFSHQGFPTGFPVQNEHGYMMGPPINTMNPMTLAYAPGPIPRPVLVRPGPPPVLIARPHPTIPMAPPVMVHPQIFVPVPPVDPVEYASSVQSHPPPSNLHRSTTYTQGFAPRKESNSFFLQPFRVFDRRGSSSSIQSVQSREGSLYGSRSANNSKADVQIDQNDNSTKSSTSQLKLSHSHLNMSRSSKSLAEPRANSHLSINDPSTMAPSNKSANMLPEDNSTSLSRTTRQNSDTSDLFHLPAIFKKASLSRSPSRTSRSKSAGPSSKPADAIPFPDDLPLIYSAFISELATVFRSKMTLKTLIKDGLEYTDCFTGRSAVDLISRIIRSKDRNLALILGRALDAQKLFHDVAWIHRLRDSNNEVYQFRHHPALSWTSLDRDDVPEGKPSPEDTPSGVFVLLTHCYSPTCGYNDSCYSLFCPRRLAMSNKISEQSQSESKQGSVSNDSWSQYVPKSIVESISEVERKRQEAIFELISSEKNFIDDMKLIQGLYIEPLTTPLSSLDPSVSERIFSTKVEFDDLEKFVTDVFLNYSTVYTKSSRLAKILLNIQQDAPGFIVEKIGHSVPNFYGSKDLLSVYVEYAGGHVKAKGILALERKKKGPILKWIESLEQHPKCRRLPLESFLSAPTTRLAKSKLLLETILKYTPEHHPDTVHIPMAVLHIKAILEQINVATGRADNRFKLDQLKEQLVVAPHEAAELDLEHADRVWVRDGPLILKKAGGDAEVHVFLLDHVLVICKKRKNGQLKLFRNIIPLLLLAFQNEKSDRSDSGDKIPASVNSSPTVAQVDALGKYPILFKHLGKTGGNNLYTFFCSNFTERKGWKECIEKQQEKLLAVRKKFDVELCSDKDFKIMNRPLCASLYDNRLVVGTDVGLWIQKDPCDPSSPSSNFTRIIDFEKITQVDILAECDIVILLADKTLWSFNIDIFSVDSPDTPQARTRKGKKLGTSVTFYKVGVCGGRNLLSVVRSAALSTTIKVYEFAPSQAIKKKGLSKVFGGSDKDVVKLFKEFYIPAESSSLYYLKTKLCVGCAKGFEVVDLETLDTQGLLDPSDPSLVFIIKEALKPMAIFRIKEEYGFYVDKLGRRARPGWIIEWQGYPTMFALVSDYLLAFDNNFIEVRHVDTGLLLQAMPFSNLRVLSMTQPDQFYFASDGLVEYETIYKLLLKS